MEKKKKLRPTPVTQTDPVNYNSIQMGVEFTEPRLNQPTVNLHRSTCRRNLPDWYHNTISFRFKFATCY